MLVKGGGCEKDLVRLRGVHFSAEGAAMEKENRASQKVDVCRKDMQCKCPKCLESFHATRDLLRPLPPNNAFHPITNLEDRFRSVLAEYNSPTPPRFRAEKENHHVRNQGNDEKICTPGNPLVLQRSRVGSLKPQKAGLDFLESSSRGSHTFRWSLWRKVLAVMLGLAAVMVAVPIMVSRLYPPSLSDKEVSGMALDSRIRTKVYDRFDYVRRRLLQSLPEQNISSCTGGSAEWRLKDGQNLVQSVCTFYSSPAESVLVWGFPLKTSGVLGRSSRFRSFTVISGRVLEWREGGMDYEIHGDGGVWTLPQWASSVVHLESNTWIVEYKLGLLSGLGCPTGIAQIFAYQIRRFYLHCRAAFDVTTLAYSETTVLRVDDGVMPT